VNDDRYREIIEGLFGDGVLKLDAHAEHELRHEDYVMEMPQSGERIVGREGKIPKETRHYAEPFEAPAWCSEWVEKM
jgi:hypothetical protein